MSHILSKSKYIRGLQCDRALWLDVHNPRLAKYTRKQMQRFDRGREFEYAFKATFPDGIDISAELKRNVDAYPALTAQLLDRLHTPSPLRGTPPNFAPLRSQAVSPAEPVRGGEQEALVLFEAGFYYDDVLVLADVVKQREDGTLDIYEVKSGSALSETYKRDAALQHYVISHCREIHSFNIVHNGPPASLPAERDHVAGRDAGGPFVIIDLTEELAAQHDEIEKNIAAMKAIALATNEPDTPTGAHCLEPYGCPYQSHCQNGVRQLALF